MTTQLRVGGTMDWRWPFGVSVAVISLGMVAGRATPQEPRRFDRGTVEREVHAVIERHPGPIRSGFWLGGATGAPIFAEASGEVFPTASAIKTAILIELFARYSDALDRPVPDLDALVGDGHPTIAHFTVEHRDEVRRGLAGASVRRLGGIMMGSIPASNTVYNAAASVAIARLGGPEATTRLIHERDPAFVPIVVRRYMLADRTKPGDNVATPAALAAVWQRLAAGSVRGVDARTLAAIVDAIEARSEVGRGRIAFKEGSLESDPITVVRSGRLDPTGGGPPVVFVVMLAEPNPGPRSRDQANRDLAATGDRLVGVLIDAPPVAR